MMNSSTIIRLSLLLVVAAILDEVSKVECGGGNDLKANTWENYLILSKGQAGLGLKLLGESRPAYARRLNGQVNIVKSMRLDMGKKVGLGGTLKEAFGPDDGPAEGVDLGYQHNILHPGTDLEVDPTAFKPRSLMDSLAAGAYSKAQEGSVKELNKGQ